MKGRDAITMKQGVLLLTRVLFWAFVLFLLILLVRVALTPGLFHRPVPLPT
jgi:hypothetical protein